MPHGSLVGTVVTGRGRHGIPASTRVGSSVSARKTTTTVTGIGCSASCSTSRAGENDRSAPPWHQSARTSSASGSSAKWLDHPHTPSSAQVPSCPRRAAVTCRSATPYRPQFYFRTTDVTGVVSLPRRRMVMPGDAPTKVRLISRSPWREGLKFQQHPRGWPHRRRRSRHQDHQVIWADLESTSAGPSPRQKAGPTSCGGSRAAATSPTGRIPRRRWRGGGVSLISRAGNMTVLAGEDHGPAVSVQR
ncbi:hypothetical protein HF086_000895 [Spodoptera exigua]|uniref:Uncharacterized protein n=1 Tax=Spodoptera exigua TaxID=7107 RepID=A0A922M0P9_SPOEX|nr:hypothetical protein HF086_000895 [Spodoptera exigua]